MKKYFALLLALLTALSSVLFAGCSSKDNIYKADAELQAKADEVVVSIGADARMNDYLNMREELMRYKNSTRRSEIKDKLTDLKKKYAGLDPALSLDSGASYVNEQLFEYLVVRAFYSKRTLDETLLDSSEGVVDIITDSGYNLAYEWMNAVSRIGTKYYFGNKTVHDDLNYYSLCTLSDGSIEYMSLPLFYEPLTEQFVESYAARSASERATVFEDSVKYFTEKADVRNNAVLKLIYTDDELGDLQAFLDGLDLSYIDENNIATEEEAYSNRQLAIELGDTRFILRITIYGMFMDVVQNKDYYKGSFSTDLDILRQAYLGTEPVDPKDDMYIVIGK